MAQTTKYQYLTQDKQFSLVLEVAPPPKVSPPNHPGNPSVKVAIQFIGQTSGQISASPPPSPVYQYSLSLRGNPTVVNIPSDNENAQMKGTMCIASLGTPGISKGLFVDLKSGKNFWYQLEGIILTFGTEGL